MGDGSRLAAAQGLIVRPPSERSAIAPFIVMDVMRAAAAREAEGARIIHMEVGQPGTPAPRAAREAVKRALDSDNLGYTLALGIEPLRERIARLYQDRHGVTVGSGARGGDKRLVGRVRAGVPGSVRRRRQGGAAGAGLSLLSPHPDCARCCAGHAGDRPQHALDADGSADRGGGGAAGAGRASDREPRQSDRHHARAGAAGRDRRRPAAGAGCGSSRTRSITA